MTVNQKVEKLRDLMKKEGFSAYLINGTDPHNSEYVGEHWKTRQYLTSFSGSAGTVLVTANQALIWVDSRYFVQCKKQIEGTCFEMKAIDGPNAEKITDFLANNFSAKNTKNLSDNKIGIADQTLMLAQSKKYGNLGLNIVPCNDILSSVWTDRPAMKGNKIRKLSVGITGQSTADKLALIREKMAEKKVDYTLVCSLDDIAWTLNLRGSDILHTPVFFSYLLIGRSTATLFAYSNVKDKSFCVVPYDSFYFELSKIKNCTIYIDPEKTNMKIMSIFDKNNIKTVQGACFSQIMKACKNKTELNGMRKTHILDAVALVNFLGAVKNGKHSYTELSLQELLEKERAREKSYLGPSFGTIAGFKEHGAIVHYSATEESNVKIKGNGLLVLDSGGQYLRGTTDVTRTLLFGKATQEQKNNYTRVLKGHLALSHTIFPSGTTGYALDVLAHRELWKAGLDYFHGTGHGVGFNLSVHEGPQRISHSVTSDIPLECGMILSDEPGVYIEGKYGIRIENLLAVVPAFKTEAGSFYTFEVLTCCPYERELINKNMLTFEEIEQINSYNSFVYKHLEKKVNSEGLKYLKKATQPL